MHLLKNNPLVTVLLPVCNGGDYILECIESILNQTFRDFELLIINDGSVDSTAESILGVHDSRIRYIENNANQGLIRTLNKGLHFSRGAYIARIDADDICHENRLEKQLDYLQFTTADVVGSNAYLHGSNETLYKPSTFDEIKINLLVNCCVIHPSVMIKKKKILENSLYYDKNAIYAEDYKLWVDSILNGLQLENIRENLIYYRIHGNQISTTKRMQQEVSANLIRFSYANVFFSDIIFGKEKEYLMLLYPSNAIAEERKMAVDKVFRLADSLCISNRKNGFFEKELFESFFRIRTETIENLIKSSLID